MTRKEWSDANNGDNNEITNPQMERYYQPEQSQIVELPRRKAKKQQYCLAKWRSKTSKNVL